MREVPGIGSIDIKNVEWREIDGVKYPVPYEISIEVTHNCPAYCIMCSSDSKRKVGLGRLEGEFTTEEIIRILIEGKKLGARVVSWSGGEPLIREAMDSIMFKARELGYRQWFYTSGVRWDDKGRIRPINDYWAELLVELCERVMFDIQHPDPYWNDLILGVDKITCYQHMSIYTLKDYGVKWLEAQVCPTRLNWKKIPELVVYLLDRLEFYRVSFLRFVPQGRGERVKHWLYMTPQEILILNKLLRRLQKDYGEDRVRIGRPLNFVFLIEEDYEYEPRCRACFDAPLIQPNGRVDCCPAWKKMPNKYALGNVRDKGLIWCWVHSPVAREIRRFVGAPIEEVKHKFKGVCLKCPYFEKCRGKCTAQRMLAYNFDWYMTPDPQCPYAEQLA